MDGWYSIAKGLPLNGHIRVTCCNNNTTAIISHSSKGYRFHCFRCGETHWKEKGPMTLSELYSDAFRKGAECAFKEKLNGELPSDACKDFPDAERVWLAEGGVLYPELPDGPYWYSPSLQRVLLPVHTSWYNDNPTGYQARSCHIKPKYVSSGDASVNVTPRDWYDSSSICITEDILSSRKVGQLIPSVALIGTSLTDAAIGAIINYPATIKKIHVWLDPDSAGQEASKKIAARLRALFSVSVLQVHSESDPKKIPRNEIRGYLEY